MESAEAFVVREGGETITLEVRRSNIGAQALYSTMGYSTVGTRPGYYADGEDGMVMTKMFTAREPLYDGYEHEKTG